MTRGMWPDSVEIKPQNWLLELLISGLTHIGVIPLRIRAWANSDVAFPYLCRTLTLVFALLKLAQAGSITPIKPGPFQIGTHEDRARRPCWSPAALQGLTGIVIPSRKTQAPSQRPTMFHSRYEWGCSNQEASLIVGLSKPPANRRLVWLCELLKLCAFLFSSTLAHRPVSSSRNDFAKHEVTCLHVPRKSLDRTRAAWYPKSEPRE